MSKGSGMLTTFSWRTFDLASRLPDNWQQQLIDAAAGADFREYPRTFTSTEVVYGVADPGVTGLP